MNIPTDYLEGYEKARKVDPDLADKYMAHTHIGDPLGEAMTDDLAELDTEEQWRLIQVAMDDDDEEALRNVPASLRAFFKDAERTPDWLDYAGFAPGVRMFHRDSSVILAAFVAGVLIEGFTTNIAKSFFITGRVRDQGVRRPGAEQPAHDGDLPPWRHVQTGRWLEALGPYSDSPRAGETPPEQDK